MSHHRVVMKLGSYLVQSVRGLCRSASVVSETVHSTPTSNIKVHGQVIPDPDGRTKLVIFDKDGTLTCFTSMWRPFLMTMISRLAAITGINNIEGKALSVLGVCSKTQKIESGVLAEGTNSQVRDALTELLRKEGLSSEAARAIVSESLAFQINFGPGNLQQLRDLKLLFSTLRGYGIKIAVCTSDCRESTVRSLIELDVVNLVDKVVCGDDPTGLPKPTPHNALMICDQLRVHPKQTVMVGDTITDMEFAKNSKLSMGIGVLSGIGKKEQLQQAGADHVVETIEDILPIVLPSRTINITPKARKIGEKDWELIIMDKDGTLSNMQKKWLFWALSIGQRLKKIVNEGAETAFYDVIGLDRSSYSIYGALLTYTPVLEVKQLLSQLLLMKGVPAKDLNDIMSQVWEDGSQFSEEPIEGVVDSLIELRSGGNRKLALLTCDVRASTEKFLSQIGATELFDVVLTNDDLPDAQKPLPHGIYQITERLNVPVHKTMMVGDSRIDMHCGQAASVGANIAVLSGINHAEALIHNADVLLPNLTFLPKLLKLRK